MRGLCEEDFFVNQSCHSTGGVTTVVDVVSSAISVVLFLPSDLNGFSGVIDSSIYITKIIQDMMMEENVKDDLDAILNEEVGGDAAGLQEDADGDEADFFAICDSVDEASNTPTDFITSANEDNHQESGLKELSAVNGILSREEEHGNVEDGESSDEIAILQEIEPKKSPTGLELFVQYKDLIMTDFNDVDKEEYWKKIDGKVKQIQELDDKYLDSSAFLALVEASMSDFLDCKVDEQRKAVLIDFFNELRVDNTRKLANKKRREEQLKAREEYREKKKVDPKTRPPEFITNKADRRRKALLAKLNKDVVRLQKQHDRYEQKELTLDELEDDYSPYVMQTSIVKKVSRF